jgi:hypothetical protein
MKERRLVAALARLSKRCADALISFLLSIFVSAEGFQMKYPSPGLSDS